jgi:hypothetical protein
LTPAATAVTPDYTLEAVFDTDLTGPEDPPGFMALLLRRTDDVGTPQPGPPDGHGSVTGQIWGSDPRSSPPRPCVDFSLQTLDFADAVPRAFAFGIAGPGLDHLEVVLVDGTRVTTPIGTAPPGLGLRGWLVERPLGDVDRVEGLDAGGDVIVTTPIGTQGTGGFGC